MVKAILKRMEYLEERAKNDISKTIRFRGEMVMNILSDGILSVVLSCVIYYFLWIGWGIILWTKIWVIEGNFVWILSWKPSTTRFMIVVALISFIFMVYKRVKEVTE